MRKSSAWNAGATFVDYLMIIVVVSAIAIPIVRMYFGDQIQGTLGRNREKLVSLLGQERKKPVPNEWFNQEPSKSQNPPNLPDGPSSRGPGDGPGSGPDVPPLKEPDVGGGPNSGPGFGPDAGPISGPASGASPSGQGGARGPAPGNSYLPNGSPSPLENSGGPTTSPGSPERNSPADRQDLFFKTVQKNSAQRESQQEGDLTAKPPSHDKLAAKDPKTGDPLSKERAASGKPPGGDPPGPKGKWSWWFLIRFLLLILLILVILYVGLQSLRKR